MKKPPADAFFFFFFYPSVVSVLGITIKCEERHSVVL